MSHIVDITVVVNFHREGVLAISTIKSVLACIRHVLEFGVKVEWICVLDNSDDLTKRVVENYAKCARIIPVSFQSLAASRNFAASESRGKYVAFIDGDDLWGFDWLCAAYKLAESFVTEKVIIHPKINIYFGRGVVPFCLVHPDMRYEKVSIFDIAVANRWTALSFACREIYEEYKYVDAAIDHGFAFEDWSWNFITVKAGIRHIVTDQGVHFIRKKRFGSMSAEANARLSLPLLC